MAARKSSESEHSGPGGLHRTAFASRYQSMHAKIRRRRFFGSSQVAGLALAGATALAAGQARATWSIVLIDTRTGEVAVGSATCLFGFDLRANTPVLLPMIGGGAAQSAIDADGTNRVYIREGLLDGVTPSAIITGLSGFDSGHQTHQYGIADTRGGTTTFTGTSAAAWAGGVTGAISQPGGDIIYAIQGNILTGSPVVLVAENAIRTTEGDIATRLMAGMEAARSMGGDGRCSCSSGPTACGSPPNVPWQLSAGIAYMLIGRDGDREGSSPIYKVRSALPIDAADLNGDGKLDLVAGSTASVFQLINSKLPTGPIRLANSGSTATASGPRAVVTGKFDADNFRDVATVNVNNGTVSVLIGKGDGTFKPRVDYPVGTQPIGMVSVDLNQDGVTDLAALNSFASAPSVGVLIGNGDGTFKPVVTTALTSTPSGIVAGDFNGDGKPDLAVIAATAKTLTVLLGNGAGALSAAAAVSVPVSVNSVAAGDFDKDGLTDLVAAGSGDPTVLLLKRSLSGFAITSFASGATGVNAVTVGDLDQDGNLDFAAGTRSQNGIITFMGDGAGGFAPMQTWPINNVPSRLIAADMDNDGDLDLVSTSSGLGTVTITPNFSKERGLPPGQVELASIGCASGDYFMEFNVLGPGPGNQDPVFVCKDLFDAWRADLVDKADAVQSRALLSRTILPADGKSVATIDVTIRDWQGNRVSRPLNLTAAHHEADLAGRDASDGICTISAVTSLGNGDYRLTVKAGLNCGEDRIAISVQDPAAPAGSRPVILMPSPRVTISATADRDGNGVVDAADFAMFMDEFGMTGEAADLNNDGVVDLADFFRFFNSFDQPCVD